MENRFRAWDGESKKMIYWTLNDLLCRFGDPEYQFGVKDRPSPLFDWMQETGLKDKNGKLIYGGDLIELIYRDTPNGYSFYGRDPKYEKVVGEVQLSFGSWSIKHTSPNTGKVVYGNLYRVNKDNPKEIIGNKFQNPELLKD